MTSSASVTVVVPTRNRPHLLPDLLRSLAEQSVPPVAVVIVDSSDSEVRFEPGLVGTLPFAVELIFEQRASAPHQRNVGAALAKEVFGSEYVLFLDDDVAPSRDYVERLVDVLGRDVAEAIGGVSGSTQWVPGEESALRRRLRRVFLLTGKPDGRVLRSGVNMPVGSDLQGLRTVEWLFGCSMWRRSVLMSCSFHDSLPGQALFDDVEFSVRVARAWELVVDTDAFLGHALSEIGRPDNRMQYERSVRNRAEVIRALGGGWLRWAAFWWSVLGEAVLLARHVHSSADYRSRMVGLGVGAVRTLRRLNPR